MDTALALADRLTRELQVATRTFRQPLEGIATKVPVSDFHADAQDRRPALPEKQPARFNGWLDERASGDGSGQ